MKFEKGSYADRAIQYAKNVTAGKIPACWQIKSACQRTLDDLKRKDLIFDEDRINHICSFAENLVHTKGQWARKPIILEPFQIWIFANLFGFVRKSDGLRRFSDCLILLPRKNGKSLIAAVIALYMAFLDGEEGAEVYIGAANRDQANEVFLPTKRIAELTPNLIEALDIEIMAESVFNVASGSRIQRVIGKAKDGASVHLGICDEVHQHKDSTQVDAFRTGRGARSQPLLLLISTAGFNLAGVCRTEQLAAEAILKKETVGDNVFAAIWTLDPEDDWRDFDNWRKANPNLGVSISEKFLRDEHTKALQSPANQAAARTKYLNQWVASADAWLNTVDWSNAADHDLDINDHKGARAYLGIDLSTKQDLTAIVAVVPLTDGKRAIFPFSFLPNGALASSVNAPAYTGWIADGDLIETEGSASSFAEAEEKIAWLMKHFTIECAVFDQWQGEGLRQRLEAGGLKTMVWAANNRAEWTRAMEDFEADLKNGLIVHPSNAVLDWCAANICASEKGVSRIPVKPHKDKKIDTMIATLMAFAASNVTPPAEAAPIEMFFLD